MGCGASAAKKKYDPFDQSPKDPQSNGARRSSKERKKDQNLRQSVVSTLKANIDDDFDISDEPCGSGHTGSVFHCVEKESGEGFVVKLIMRRGRSIQELEREMNLQKALDHPHICRVYQSYADARCFYIIMERLRGGSLVDRVVAESALSEGAAARLVRQLATAVAHMHKQKVCHGDVKPENAFFADRAPVSEGVLKLIDFGHAQRFRSDSVLTKRPNAPRASWYTAPEVLDDSFSASCDVYSLGVLAHVLVVGSAPFWGGDKAFKDDCSARGKRQRKSVREGMNLPKERRGSCSPAAFDFVQRTVCPESKRMDITAVLEHVFLDHAASTAPLSAGLMRNLRSFHKHSVLERTALTHFARHLDAGSTAELRKVFQKLDKNGDGTLTLEEFMGGLAPLGVPPAQIQETFETLDTDNSRSIDYTEFLGAALAKRQVQDEVKWWGVFRQFNASGDGRLSRDEVVFVLSGGRADRFEGLTDFGDDLEIKQAAAGVGEGLDFEAFLDLMKSSKAAAVKSGQWFTSLGSPSPIAPSGSNFFSQRKGDAGQAPAS